MFGDSSKGWIPFQTDVEMGYDNSFDVDARRGFIRKVFGTLL